MHPKENDKAIKVFIAEFFILQNVYFFEPSHVQFLSASGNRDAALILVGIALSTIWKILSSCDRTQDTNQDSCDDKHAIRTIEVLRALLPPGIGGTNLEDAKKVIGFLDDQMMNFIARSPILYLTTMDPVTKMPFCSPKGDEPGFVKVLVLVVDDGNTKKHTLVIPDRPGNRLLFGLQNMIGHTKASVLFQVPGTPTTLRCGGSVRLSTNPELLRQNVARGCPPKLLILLEIEHAFFHCAKAFMRGKVWDPTSWPLDPPKVCFGRYFAKQDAAMAKTIDANIDEHYQQIQKAVDGKACERET